MSRSRLWPALLTLSTLLVTALAVPAAPAAAPPAASQSLACATIPELQGPGLASPCQGHREDIRGCITGITAAGFFFQDFPGDDDPATSDAIYARYGPTWTNLAGLRPGVMVSVAGTVTEFHGATVFADRPADPLEVTVIMGCMPPLPAPPAIRPYLDPYADPQLLYERYESMRVRMTFDGWVVGPTKRYGAGVPEIALVDYRSSIPGGNRVFERDYPGYGGITYLSGGLDVDLPDLDFGDLVWGTAATGILAYQYGRYTLLVDLGQVEGTDELVVLPAVELLDPATGAFDVCYFNADDLFDHVNDGRGDWGDWAPGWPASGTAAGAAAYRDKLGRVAGVVARSLGGCALVGLEEVEGKQQVWDDLAAEVTKRANPRFGARTWAGRYVESGDPRDRSQGFLVRDDVELLGGGLQAVQGAPYTGWVSDGQLDFVRVPAAGQFRFNAGTPNEVTLWAYAVHFKSKRASSSCSTPDCTSRREKEAADLRDILLHHRAAGEYAIAGGDLNDGHGSSTIAILDGAPGPGASLLTGLWYELPERTRYSYISNGESQALDHVYVTNLPVGPGPWKRDLHPVHVEADFASRKQASDHDPLRVIFRPPAGLSRLYLPVVLRTPAPHLTPTPTATHTATPSATPTATPTWTLLPTRPTVIIRIPSPTGAATRTPAPTSTSTPQAGLRLPDHHGARRAGRYGSSDNGLGFSLQIRGFSRFLWATSTTG